MIRQPVCNCGRRTEEFRSATEMSDGQVLCALSIVGEGSEHREAEGGADFVWPIWAGTDREDGRPPLDQSQNFDSPLTMRDSLQAWGNDDHQVASRAGQFQRG